MVPVLLSVIYVVLDLLFGFMSVLKYVHPVRLSVVLDSGRILILGPEWTNELTYSTAMCNGTAPTAPPKQSSCDTSLEPFYNLSYMYISTWVCKLDFRCPSPLASKVLILHQLTSRRPQTVTVHRALVRISAISAFTFRLGLFTVLIVGNIVSLLTGRQKVDDLKQGVLTPLYSRSFLCKWMPKASFQIHALKSPLLLVEISSHP